MSVNSLPKTVTRQRRDCDLNPGPSAPESSTLTTRLPSYPVVAAAVENVHDCVCYLSCVNRQPPTVRAAAIFVRCPEQPTLW